MKLDITTKAIMAAPFLFLNDLKSYYEEFKQEHGEPESIVMNEDQKSWYKDAVKNAEEAKETSYKEIVIE
jgi:esterase/lipase